MTKMATTLTPKTIVITTVRRPSPSLSPSSDNSDDMECAPRKRRRLTHLSPDEKVMRRKMKNRVAAQTARDRKKALMSDLEIRVAELEAENRMLQVENGTLRTKSSRLTEENHELKERLGQTDSSCVTQKKVLGSPESAVLNAPLQQEQIQTLSHWSDFLLGLLEQISGEVGQGETGDSKLGAGSSTGFITSKENSSVQPKMVGPSTEELESVKELIKFDHVYYKTDCVSAVQVVVMPETSPAVDTIDIVDSSESLVTDNSSESKNCEVLLQKSKELPKALRENDLSVTLGDLEDLFKQEGLQAVPVMDTSSSVSQEKISVKSDLCTDITNVIQTPDCSPMDMSDIFSADQSLDLLSQPVAALSPLSVSCADSGIGDYNSDLGSPLSDTSSPLESSGWEESFTELFPGLDWAMLPSN